MSLVGHSEVVCIFPTFTGQHVFNVKYFFLQCSLQCESWLMLKLVFTP